jgi:hypothetical protein
MELGCTDPARSVAVEACCAYLLASPSHGNTSDTAARFPLHKAQRPCSSNIPVASQRVYIVLGCCTASSNLKSEGGDEIDTTPLPLSRCPTLLSAQTAEWEWRTWRCIDFIRCFDFIRRDSGGAHLCCAVSHEPEGLGRPGLDHDGGQKLAQNLKGCHRYPSPPQPGPAGPLCPIPFAQLCVDLAHTGGDDSVTPSHSGSLAPRAPCAAPPAHPHPR